MRNGLIGIASAIVLVSTMAIAGCNNSNGGGGGGSGGASSSGGTTSAGGTGGTAGSGGTSSTGGKTGSGGTTASGGNPSGGTSTGGTSSGGGSGGSSGNSVTTLSGTKTIGSLSTDEATQLCDDTYGYFRSAIPQATACKWKGLAYATSSSAPTEEKLRSNCSTKQTSCLAAEPSAVWPNPGCAPVSSTCTATVADYATCIADEVAGFNQTVGGLPACADFTMDGTSAIWDVMGADLPASCTSLNNKCPELYPPTLVM